MRFDKEAKLWDEKPRRVELANKVVEYVKREIKNSDKILDFGCGTGLVGLNFDNEVIGIDLSCEMVNIFNQKAKILNKKAKAFCLDVNNLTQKFDVIVANMVFHHIEKIDTMLELLSMKLNKNGKLFISDLYLEDGTFHDKGNDDVFHFGFEKEDFKSEYFKIVDYSKIYTIFKKKQFDVFITYLRKVK